MKTRKPRIVIIRIVCLDQKGLVARFASFLAHHGGNILDSEDHGEDGKFFQRIVADITGVDV
ncbi:MAG: formyltetrahydrofolate deformylase, partial [Candidatus Kaiserbacteria bacterium]|nr:formyltetrahydrofolate deformylase [Candidatus Kaiserbacteria bacterium]